MKRSFMVIATVLTVGLSIAGLAFAHSTSNDGAPYSGHMFGMMGGSSGHMGMNFSDEMFDLDQISAELNLSNDQLAILSQLEATHIQLQGIMHDQLDLNGGVVGHHQMMSLMSENVELMNSHLELFEDFEKSLTDPQTLQWRQLQGYCH